MAAASPRLAGVLIRDVISSGTCTYVVVNMTTHETLGGPFSSLAEATLAGLDIAETVWRENTDERGRPIGSPIRLPFTRR